jgi:hypothetical protein
VARDPSRSSGRGRLTGPFEVSYGNVPLARALQDRDGQGSGEAGCKAGREGEKGGLVSAVESHHGDDFRRLATARFRARNGRPVLHARKIAIRP